jgi:hypothetical protein
MEFIANMFKHKKRVAAVDAGSRGIKIIVMEKTGGDDEHPEFTLEYEIIEGDLFDALKSRKTRELEGTVRKALERLAVSHSVPVHLIVSRDLTVHTDHEFRGASDDKLQKGNCFNVPFSLSGTFKGNETKSNTIYLPKRHVFALFRFFKACGISLASVNVGPLALAEAMVYSLHEDERFDTLAIIDFGASQSTCCVKVNDKLVSVAMFNQGGDHLTHLIAEKLKIKESDAEHVKRAEYERTLSVMHSILDEFTIDIKKYFAFLKEMKNIIPKKVFITGGSARITGMVYYLEDLLHLPVQLWGIRGKITLKKKLYGKRRFVYDEATIAVGMGIFVDVVAKIKDFGLSSVARALGAFMRVTKCFVLLVLILFALYGAGIYIENLGIVRDFIAHYEELERIASAKDRGTFIQLEGIDFRPEGSLVLVNNKLLKEGAAINEQLVIKKIEKGFIVLEMNGIEHKLQPSEYLIIDAARSQPGKSHTTLFSIIREKISFK